ncbi:MAG: large protein, partial [Verrucomicrobiales bacterium]|nr:large protein [Verrucomicrobiales bacterium]
TGFSTNTAQEKADSIHQYVLSRYATNGPRPDWLVLNEISSSQWPANDIYRQWTTNVVHILATNYGYNVIIYAPFANPGTANAVYWRAIANDGYIGIENYLSGTEIKAQNFSVSYCQGQYQSSVTSYTACGVAKPRLILGEHFACNTYTNSDGTTNSWGRSGVSYDDWEKAMIARNKAALNVGFSGFATYAWAKNGMFVSDPELIHFEDIYRTNYLPATLSTTPVALVAAPISSTNALGSTATFSVTVSGTTPINFQWQHNSVNLADGGNVGGALSSSLVVSALQASDGGTYTVLVGNATGSFQSSATLTMLLPPSVTSQPSDNAVLAGGTATFSVVVSGTAPFTYQWRKAGVPIANGGNISGALSPTLTISNVQNSDLASYSVSITNNYGNTTSSNALLSIQTPINITTQPVSQTRNYGTNVVFSTAVTGGAPVYQWQKNSTPLTDSAHVAGSTTANLTVSSLTTADQASYNVIVSNQVSSATSSSATLTILDPAIISQPQSTNVTYGKTIVLQVGAAGSPTLNYQWQKNSTNLANAGSVSGATTPSLTINQTTNIDSGTYTVRISNAVSNLTSSPAIVSVFQAPPTINTQPTSRTSNAGTIATFTVSATGPSLAYQWYKGAVALNNANNISGATTSALSLGSVLLADEGTYSVVITNPVGSVTSSNATLSVVFPMPYYEPFVYFSGAVLGGQTNANFLLWTEVGTNASGSSVTVQPGNLNYAGLPASIGNEVQFGGSARSARLSLPTGRSVTNGTIYYSHLFKVTNTNGLSTSGVFISGFNNSTGSQGTTPSVVGTRLYLRAVAGGYNVGVAKNDSTAANWVWDPRTFTTADTLLLVGSYTFGTVANTTDDVCKLWVNPSASELGTPSPTSTPLTASVGSDIASDQIASFVVLQRSAVEPTAMLIDELRIDTTWAGVTGSSAPVILTQPVSQQVNAVANANFSVAAGGSAPLSYQWRKNGGAINAATNSTLTLSSVGAADVASYSVAVTNLVGTTTSADAMLTVSFPSPQLLSMIANGDGSFSLTWNVSSGVAYNFQFANTISNSSWTTLATITPTSNSLVTTDGPLTNATGFYRLSSSQNVSSQAGFLRITALGNSDTFVSVPFTQPSGADWTLNTVFPNSAGVNVSPTVGNRNTEVLMPDVTSPGINLSSTKIYFFNSGLWKQVGQGSANHNDDVLPPNSYFIVRHNVPTNTVITTLGNVVTTNLLIPLQTLATNRQDNSVALMRPVPVSLNDSGLISSGAFTASPLPGSRTDELLTFDNSATNRNKSTAAIYYFWNSGWRQVGAGSADVGTNQPLGNGTGVIIRKGTNNTAPIWTNSPN